MPVTTVSILLTGLLSFAVVLLIAGLIFLAVGLLGKIRIKEYELGTDSPPIRILMGVIGLALIVAAFFVYQPDESSTPANSNTNLQFNPSPTPNPSVTATPSPSPTSTPANPNSLIDVIKKVQNERVKESYGELEGQNFSDRDLASFLKNGTIADIKDSLKKDGEFLDVVLAIKSMSMTDRQKLLTKARTTYKPTWVELGRVDRVAGQTAAGQKAERMIAEAIVNLVKELSRLPDDQIKSMQNE
jgi:hypothetical protein